MTRKRKSRRRNVKISHWKKDQVSNNANLLLVKYGARDVFKYDAFDKKEGARIKKEAKKLNLVVVLDHLQPPSFFYVIKKENYNRNFLNNIEKKLGYACWGDNSLLFERVPEEEKKKLRQNIKWINFYVRMKKTNKWASLFVQGCTFLNDKRKKMLDDQKKMFRKILALYNMDIKLNIPKNIPNR